MALVDTSVWVEVLRDANHRPVLEDALGGQDVVLTRFTQLELLQGSRDEREWQLLAEHLEAQNYLEFTPATWAAAARIYFDLRRDGKAGICGSAGSTSELGDSLRHQQSGR